jgi:hypothetical protein
MQLARLVTAASAIGAAILFALDRRGYLGNLVETKALGQEDAP